MTTIIAVYDKSGKCIGRCDASCYNAVHDKCTCICHGANHGKGRELAEQNTRELAGKWLDKIEHNSVEIPAMQLSLFESDEL